MIIFIFRCDAKIGQKGHLWTCTIYTDPQLSEKKIIPIRLTQVHMITPDSTMYACFRKLTAVGDSTQAAVFTLEQALQPGPDISHKSVVFTAAHRNRSTCYKLMVQSTRLNQQKVLSFSEKRQSLLIPDKITALAAALLHQSDL